MSESTVDRIFLRGMATVFTLITVGALTEGIVTLRAGGPDAWTFTLGQFGLGAIAALMSLVLWEAKPPRGR